MGTYGFTEISITYKDSATSEDIKAFIEEIKNEGEFRWYEKIKDYENEEGQDVSFFTIQSGRRINLRYQEEIVMKIIDKHKDIISEARGSAYSEIDSCIYYEE